MIRTLVARGRDQGLIGLQLADLEADASLGWQSEEELVVVVLTGRVRVEIDGLQLGEAGGRSSVFEAAGYAVYVAPGATFRLIGVSAARLAVASAPAGDGTPGASRIIGPADQRIAEVGRDNWARTVRTILGPEDAAARLLLGETINPPGNWSSYPPHKHDRQAPPDEARLEEVYLFQVQPAGGFGVQVHYEDGLREASIVRDEEVAIIRSGYHPVVAAPGYALYYLWVMAGDGREMFPFLDPDHSWVRDA
jgi:5-deoxy-glucuronate isomerase